MKTVIDNSLEIIINKSKFITFVCKVDDIDSVNEKLEEIKKQYKDANHYCYAYIIDNSIKFNDDKEPSGTAGLPILNVLQKENVNHVLCVVVRYFGGIKLGSGGLIRTYSKACKNCLKTKQLINGYEIKISFNYDAIKEIDYLLKDCYIEKEFNENTTYKFKIEKDKYLNIEEKLKKISYIEYIKDILI